MEKDWRRFFIVGVGSAILLILACMVLLAIAHYTGGESFKQAVLQMEVLGRMDAVRTPAFYFYFIESLGAYALIYPLAIVIILLLLPRFKFLLERNILLKLIAWVLVILIGLSIPADKKVRYVLPMAPALALICGYLLVATAESISLKILRSIVKTFCFLFPFVCLVLIVYLHRAQPVFDFEFLKAVWFFAVMQLAIIVSSRQFLIAFALTAVTYIGATILVVEPINLGLNRTHEFVMRVEALRDQAHSPLIFYREGTDGLVIKYLAQMTREEKPLFLKQPSELVKLPKKSVVIATDENFQMLPQKQTWHILMRGALGREPVVVFSKNASRQEGGS
jgi:4-amino-4-deoxy-L-arabinose transferase-like glycosyltransferase